MSIGEETVGGINEVGSYMSRNVPPNSIMTASKSRKPFLTAFNNQLAKEKAASGISKTRSY